MKWTRQRCQLAEITLRTAALVGIRNHGLDPMQPAAREAMQEIGPERFGLGGTGPHPEHLATPVGVRPDCDYGLHQHDATGLADMALRDPADTHCLHQIIDRAGRDALHVGFLDHPCERILRCATRFQKGWDVAYRYAASGCTGPSSGARIPLALAVTVREVMRPSLRLHAPRRSSSRRRAPPLAERRSRSCRA